jgi:transcriptional regulator with XRE-family HTH domain
MAEKTGFGRALTDACDAAGITRADLSRRVGVSQPAVASVVAKDNPSLAVAMRYLSELGYEVALVQRGKKLPEGSYVMGEGGDAR